MTDSSSMSQSFLQRASEFSIAGALLAWFRKNQRPLPWRQRFAAHADPYHIWVSEIMLQQTTIGAVIPAYERFLEQFPKLENLAAADEVSIRLACRGLGYYRRFRMLHQAAQILVARKPFAWPNTFIDWRALPGIGEYTAAAISSIAFAQPKAVVDGNVERVFCRLLDLQIIPDGKLKKMLQKLGDQLVPQAAPGDYNQAVMELGQTVCTKQNPNCADCPLQGLCKSYELGSQALAPAPRKPIDFEEVKLHLYFVLRGDQVGLVERAADAKFLGGTLGLPTARELDDGELRWEQAGQWPMPRQSLGSFKHSITKHKIQAHVHEHRHSSKIRSDFVWVDFDGLEAQLLSNLDRKALTLLQKHRTKH